MNNQTEEEEEEEYDSELFLQYLNNNQINRFFSEDILSFNFLGTLLYGYPYIPFTGGALRPSSLNHIINDIIINNRKRIIEFGSGISTILIGRLIKKNNLNTTLISVEHDLEWSKQLSNMLLKENLGEAVQVLYSPLKNCTISIDENLWYDTEIIDTIIIDRVFDMVIIDGPPAWMKNKSRSRYPALPYMINKLNKNHSIYLDDVNRQGEKNIIELWQKEFSIKFNYSGNSLAYSYNGHSFFTEPYVY